MMSEVLSVKEKIGYGMGDAASHIIFDNVMLYMMFFYTDNFGIPAGFVGTMFLVARALDAISDPCMGLLADRRALAGVNFVRGYCVAHCHLGSSVYWPIARQISV
ncbi:transporter [Escherichia coli]|nr:transporter [Escherichia coli]